MSDGRYKTARWRRIRHHQLDKAPHCKFCGDRGIVTQATVCDHAEPHRGDIRKFWSGPFQSLCASCHNATKQKYERTGVMQGCDEHGLPLDKEHHWHDR